MPPKRKRGAAPAPPAKKAKTSAGTSGQSTVKQAIAALKKGDKGKKKNAKPDQSCPLSDCCSVWEDYDCMLNKTNIGKNNNKYYVIQLLMEDGDFYTWNRWGRVGERGVTALKPHGDLDAAIKDFEKKFRDKTKNKWDNRGSFTPVPGKYTIIEMDDDDEAEEDVAVRAEKLAALDEGDSAPRTVTAECKLDKPTRDLIELIFDEDMLEESMAKLELDVKKMPLGKLSKRQIAKGFEVLDELEAAIKKKEKKKLDGLTSQFYTVIPHSFGRKRPPVIEDLETVRKKMDMLLVLGDIELAQAMQKEKTGKAKATKELPHPLDAKYDLLQCDLEHLDTRSKEYKVIQKYLKETGEDDEDYLLEIMDIWKVKRHSEPDRFAAHKSISNRKLLWHGTSVAVVAAILKTGLRIMPHSGGRVGRGIYFASENSKSAGYVDTAQDKEGTEVAVMFLGEVALGKEHHIMNDDHTLIAPPKGYDSVVARGCQEPDPKKDTVLTLEGHKVKVPQGKPVSQPGYDGKSEFDQSEYLIYKESQNMLRYMLKLKWPSD